MNSLTLFILPDYLPLIIGPKDKRGPHKHLFTFNVTAIRKSEKIAHAELHIFKRRSRLRRPRGFFEVVVSRLFQPWQKGNKRWKRKMEAIDTRLIKCRRVGEWMRFNITTAVKYWAKYPNKNFGLWISVRGKNAPPSDFHVATGGRKDPFVVEYGIDRERLQKAKEVQLKESAAEKKKQTKYEGVEASHQTAHDRVNSHKKDSSVHTRSRRSTSNVCKRHRLFVKFEDLKWDNWIIAPKGFSMYYCNGVCPEVIQKYFDPTNHAIIQNLLHHRYKKTIPAACCVPTKLHSITMLYFEMDGSIVLKEYAEMVAESCGCR